MNENQELIESVITIVLSALEPIFLLLGYYPSVLVVGLLPLYLHLFLSLRNDALPLQSVWSSLWLLFAGFVSAILIIGFSIIDYAAS